MSDSHNDQGMFDDVAENNVADVCISPVVITAPISKRIQPASD